MHIQDWAHVSLALFVLARWNSSTVEARANYQMSDGLFFFLPSIETLTFASRVASWNASPFVNALLGGALCDQAAMREPRCCVSGVTIFWVSERANRFRAKQGVNIAVCISSERFRSFLIIRTGLFKIKQRWLTSGKLIAFKAVLKTRIFNAKRGQHVKEIKERKRGGKKWKEITKMK